MRIRLLMPRDAEAFRSLRLEGLRTAPAAFGASLAEEAPKPLCWFGERLEQAAVFAAEAPDGRLQGLLGFQRDRMLKRRHIGHVWGLFVRDAARGQGLGTGLLAAVIAHARGRVDVLHLAVGAANPGAIRLYERAGFRTYGTEPASLRADGVEATSLLMAMRLD